MPETNPQRNSVPDRNVAELQMELGQIARLASGAVQNITTQSKVNEAIVTRLLSLEAQLKRIETSLSSQL
jgi:hypothetical protein